MGKSLIIVESPAKIKTLKKFLGPEFLFESSIGHIRDLPASGFGIDIENDFEPHYEAIPGKEDVIANLCKAAKQCDTVYLCPDPDREGEAIAWHIASILPKDCNIKRITFNAITRKAVVEALEHPRDIDYPLVNAQQARRLLDRIVGYKISPILARRIQRGKGRSVSAGRVQSVALKLVVDREYEIEAFNPIEYWNLGAILGTEGTNSSFSSQLYSVDGKRIEKEASDEEKFITISDKNAADKILLSLKNSLFSVVSIAEKEKLRNPVPPFITSTLQQEASRHHGFSSAKTMDIAQTLYEGVDLDEEGVEGLITYMRTDSVRISPEALDEARAFIKEEFGDEYLPEKPREFPTKKSAQDAHEAIRPSNLSRPPEKVRDFLSKDEYHLYSLVWERFIASQMNPARYNTMAVTISAGDDIILRANGSKRIFPGFLIVYEEKNDGDASNNKDNELPNLVEGQTLSLEDVTSHQAFTKPPARFSEASLVKELEKSGIGRPSTYAAIMNKIQSRDYTVKQNRRLLPTELGCVIADLLNASFPKIMDTEFTAHMEDDLELVAEDKKEWKALIKEFWEDFIPTVELAEKEAFVPKKMTEIDCPKCGDHKLQKIWSKSKYFFGCSGYPDCDFTAGSLEELEFNRDDYAEGFDWEQKCPLCKDPMIVRHGRFGAFLGCSKYPDCRGIINIPKEGEEVIDQKNMPSCPAIGCDGVIVVRKSRFGKTFFSCSSFPDCNVIVNDLDDLESKYVDYPKTPYEKKSRKKKGAAKKKKKGAKGKKSATTKKKRRAPSVTPSALSPELAAVFGADEMPRPMVIKKIWEHIKSHDLQDSKDKRSINPDDLLAAVFGSSEPINMFTMIKALGPHIKKKGS